DSGRPDFNGSLVQLLIGLVQTAWDRSGQEWDRDEAIDAPPTPAQLQVLFAPLAQAFAFDGDGPRFMQDRTLSAGDKPAENDIAALLIDSPGEQASKLNTDHFIKRGRVEAICPDCTAAALFTLMTNAPSGGAGHRTSLRGGGPLTTLVLYDPQSTGDQPRALWRTIACNVLEPDTLRAQGDPRKTDLKHTFPWLAAQAELQPREETQPLDAHPAQMYWAMPRRIRLHFQATVAGL
ncbi:MAG: type I-E CRISPR-associated protein Cse1/CasA, partial [Betaproteobacteria bacterium HGW-Betaproteobacteria-17]